MSSEVVVGVFESSEQARRNARWLRRSGLHARSTQSGSEFEVVVPRNQEMRARDVLEAVSNVGKGLSPARISGWASVRERLLSVETVGVVAAAVVLVVLAGAVGLWLWSLSTAIGWWLVGLMIVAGLVFFHFSGMPHSAVKSPRRYSHKHDITMQEEQEVQYRLAWAREQYRKSRESRFRRKSRSQD